MVFKQTWTSEESEQKNPVLLHREVQPLPVADSPWSVGHAEARQVPVGDGEQRHDEGEETVAAEDGGRSEVLHVAHDEQRDEEPARRHGDGKPTALLRGLRAHRRHLGAAFKRLKVKVAGAAHPLDENGGDAAQEVHGVENDEAANAGEHFVCEGRRAGGVRLKHTDDHEAQT